MPYKELNYESVKEVRCISVRKLDYAMSLSSETYGPRENMFFGLNAEGSDERLLVRSSDGLDAIIFLLGKILGQPFFLFRETDYYYYYHRQDYLKEMKDYLSNL